MNRLATSPKPVLRYPGSKQSLASWIVSHLPPTPTYVEPFCGSCAVLLAKPRSLSETVNDLDGDVVNLLRVLRHRGDELAAAVELTPYAREEFDLAREDTPAPVERARRFLIRAWQGFSGTGDDTGWRNQALTPERTTPAFRWAQLPERIAPVVERLQGVHIECRPALEVIERFSSADVTIYCDPPYVTETRRAGLYQHEMDEEAHLALLAALDAHPGPVALSGYRSDLYDDRLRHWTRREAQARSVSGSQRREVLWLNAAAARYTPGSLFDLEG